MAAGVWRPAGTPVLHPGLSSVNTAVLVISSVLAFRHKIEATFVMGCAFLLLQVLEFHRLYALGLTLQTGAYGALFYSLISCHGLHVLGGLAIWAAAFVKGGEWVGHGEIYWHFVTA